MLPSLRLPPLQCAGFIAIPDWLSIEGGSLLKWLSLPKLPPFALLLS